MQDPRQDPIGSYRILCRILKNPVGPFEDFFNDSKWIASILQDL